jgi:teichuronic acid biosynthesis glycosyltransferase TuaG
MKTVSIIIPYYRNINFFSKTLNSIENQTFKDYEIIIIFDDEDKKEIFQLKKLLKFNKKIKLIINKKNIGAGPSRNTGASIAKGKYLAFIDSDDLWKKNKLKQQLNFMKKNKLDISHTAYSIINDKSKIVSYRVARNKLSYSNLLTSCDIGLSTVIIKKKLFLKYKFSSNKTKEDYSLWLKLSRKKNIYGLNKELASWRKLDNSLSSNTLQKIFDAFDIYYRQEKFNFILSITKVIILSFNFLRKSLSY